MKSKQGTAMVMAELSVMQKEMDKRKQLVNHLKVTEKENEDTLEKHKEQIGVLRKELSMFRSKTKQKEVELFARQQELASTRQGTSVLHNFASVLEHRITELESKEGPMKDYCTDLKSTIDSMNEEIYSQAQAARQSEYLVTQKKTENQRLASNIKRLRAEIARLNKRWKTVVKEVQHIVENTPTSAWPEALQFFYSAYIANSVKEGEDNNADREVHNRVFAVLDRQRRHLENSLENMKSTMAVVEKRRQSEAEKFIQRNTLFLSEVNHLREQNRKLEQRCKKYMRMALVSTEMSKRLAAPDSAGPREGVRKPALPKEARGAVTHEKASPSTPEQKKLMHNGAEVWEHRPRTGAKMGGQLWRGTTRPLSGVADLKTQLQHAEDALEKALTTVELQKLEISHLQEGVTVALDLAQTNFAQYGSVAASGSQTPRGGDGDFQSPMRSSSAGNARSRPITPGTVSPGPFGIPENHGTPPPNPLQRQKRGMRVSQSAVNLRYPSSQGLMHASASAQNLLSNSTLPPASAPSGMGPLAGISRPKTMGGSFSKPGSGSNSPSLKMTTLYSGKRPV